MFVSVETTGEVALVRVDRPPANAIDIELLDELVAALEGLAAGVPAAAVIAGCDRFFSAGVDLKAVPGYGLRSTGEWSAASTAWCSRPMECPVL